MESEHSQEINDKKIKTSYLENHIAEVKNKITLMEKNKEFLLDMLGLDKQELEVFRKEVNDYNSRLEA